MSKLSKKDYIKILKHYNITIPNNKNKIKNKAKSIMSKKLCSCIVRIPQNTKTFKNKTQRKRKKNKYDPRSIGICTFSVFKNRGLKYRNFSCKKKPKISNLQKTKKIKFRKKKRLVNNTKRNKN